jgi:hypothetical protein
MVPVNFQISRYYVIGYGKSKEKDEISTAQGLDLMEQAAEKWSHVFLFFLQKPENWALDPNITIEKTTR